MEQEETLCDKVETLRSIREFTYSDRVSAGGGCDAAVNVRTRCGWAKLRECGELLYGRRFSLKLKWTICKSYVRPAILYGSEAWCLKERSMVRAMCGVQIKDRKRSTDMMFMLGLKETIDQLAIANSVCWYGDVLRREDGHLLRRTLYFEAECQRRKEMPKRMWKRQVEEESMKVGLRREDVLCRLVECWRKSDCCRVELNLATLTYWGYYQILNIGVSLNMCYMSKIC